MGHKAYKVKITFTDGGEVVNVGECVDPRNAIMKAVSMADPSRTMVSAEVAEDEDYAARMRAMYGS